MIDVSKPERPAPTPGQTLATKIDSSNARTANALCDAMRESLQLVWDNPNYINQDGSYNIDQVYADFEANTKVKGMTREHLQKSLMAVKALAQLFFPSRLDEIFPPKSLLAEVLSQAPAATITFPD
jgi:hypothetical protein